MWGEFVYSGSSVHGKLWEGWASYRFCRWEAIMRLAMNHLVTDRLAVVGVTIVSVARSGVVGCTFAVLAMGGLVGCDSIKKQQPSAATTKSGESEHSHAAGGHSHDAKHGGHHIHLSPSGLGAEWTHQEDGTVTVYFDDVVAQGNKIESVTIQLKVQGNAPKSYTLTAKTDASQHTDAIQKSDASQNPDASPKLDGAVFAIKDQALLTALEVKEGVQVEVIAKVNGTEQRAQIVHEEHEGHHH
jgi:hypothetical protein